MKKLIHVVRGDPDQGVTFGIVDRNGEEFRDAQGRRRALPQAIMTQKLDREGHFLKQVEFCLAEEADVDYILVALAEGNPGCEVRVYNLEQVAQCPAAAIVVKKVTPHGVLPTTI